MSLKPSNVLAGELWRYADVPVSFYFPLFHVPKLSFEAKKLYAYLAWKVKNEPSFKLFGNEELLAETLSLSNIELMAALYELLKEHKVRMFHCGYYVGKFQALRFDAFKCPEINLGKYCGLRSRDISCRAFLLPAKLFCVYVALAQRFGFSLRLSLLSKLISDEVFLSDLKALQGLGFIKYKRFCKNSPYFSIDMKFEKKEAELLAG